MGLWELWERKGEQRGVQMRRRVPGEPQAQESFLGGHDLQGPRMLNGQEGCGPKVSTGLGGPEVTGAEYGLGFRS